jgi:hypothetical protein
MIAFRASSWQPGKALVILFFMKVLITACWNIWLLRNGNIFRHERPNFAKWRGKFIHDITLLQHRIKAKHRSSFLAWIAALP